MSSTENWKVWEIPEILTLWKQNVKCDWFGKEWMSYWTGNQKAILNVLLDQLNVIAIIFYEWVSHLSKDKRISHEYLFKF